VSDKSSSSTARIRTTRWPECSCGWRCLPRAYYEWLHRPESATSARHGQLEIIIRWVYEDSYGTCGHRRIHAELARSGVQAKQSQRRAPGDRTPTSVPRGGQMTHRQRGRDQPHQAQLRLGPHRNSPASPAPEPGADTAYSPTIWSRSEPWPGETTRTPLRDQHRQSSQLPCPHHCREPHDEPSFRST